MAITINGSGNAGSRRPARTEQELRERINVLRANAESAAEEYRRELSRLTTSFDSRLGAANAALAANHRRELNEIAARYEASRRAMLSEMRAMQAELDRRLTEDNDRISRSIRSLEERIEAQTQKDRRTADEYRTRMANAWAALLGRTELEPFTGPHAPTVERASSAADEAYVLEQYQAVTAIMANSIALIRSWESEAELMYRDWLEMKALCEAVLSYMHTAFSAAERTDIDCDGTLNHDIDLFRYDEIGHAELSSVLLHDDDKLAACAALSVEGMRNFLHRLETDSQRMDGTIERCGMLHRAYVRRLRAYRAIRDGFTAIHYRKLASGFGEGGFLGDISIVLGHEYDGHRLLVSVGTPDNRLPRTNISLTFVPGAAMDEQLQEKACEALSSFAERLIESTEHGTPHLSRVDPYRNGAGRYQSDVGVYYSA